MMKPGSEMEFPHSWKETVMQQQAVPGTYIVARAWAIGPTQLCIQNCTDLKYWEKMKPILRQTTITKDESENSYSKAWRTGQKKILSKDYIEK